MGNIKSKNFKLFDKKCQENLSNIVILEKRNKVMK